MKKAKTHHSPKHRMKQKRISIRLIVLSCIAVMIMIFEGIDRHHAWHLISEMTLIAPIDKLADMFVFGGD